MYEQVYQKRRRGLKLKRRLIAIFDPMDSMTINVVDPTSEVNGQPNIFIFSYLLKLLNRRLSLKKKQHTCVSKKEKLLVHMYVCAVGIHL